MNRNSTNILFLYAEVMGYTLAIAKALVKNYGIGVHIIGWDQKKVSNFKVPELSGVTYYKRSEISSPKDIVALAEKIKPSIVYVSGWMDKDYLTATEYFRKSNIPIVCGLDTQWRGSIKQYVSTLFGKRYMKKHFDYMWVAGVYQYEYARRLGYSKNQILFGIYTGDVERFNQKYLEYKTEKQKNYPHTILYVGRFNERKGINVLVEAYKNTFFKIKHNWTLTLIGNGDLKNNFENIEGVVVKDFMQPDELVREIKTAGVFCLPSNFEAWGVVVHEFTAAGLPVITSNECGSATEFVEKGYNGYTFKVNDTADLTDKLVQIISKTDEELYLMGEKSHMLAQHINPDISASNLMSIINY